MTGLTGAVWVMVAIKPLNFRKGAAGLAVPVRAKMAADPFYCTLYVFRGKRRRSSPKCRSPTDVPVAFYALEGINLVHSSLAGPRAPGCCGRRMERLLGR